jgi:hypothetical protein
MVKDARDIFFFNIANSVENGLELIKRRFELHGQRNGGGSCTPYGRRSLGFNFSLGLGGGLYGRD